MSKISKHSGSVLVLEDDQSSAQTTSFFLRKLDMPSVISLDPNMALKQLKTGQFKLFMFDAIIKNRNILEEIMLIKDAFPQTPMAVMVQSYRAAGGVMQVPSKLEASKLHFSINKPLEISNLKTLMKNTNIYHRKRSTDLNVLVIEPEQQLRLAIAGGIEVGGHHVGMVNTVEDALFDYDLSEIDVVITAILIPGIGGVEGIKQIRKDFPDMLIVAMSEGISDKITAHHVLIAAKEAGADLLLPKPVDLKMIMVAVSNLSKVRHEEKNNS